MSFSSSFLVSGATGQQGGAVVRALLKAGHRVRALVRDPSKPQAKELESLGAVLFVGDYSNAEAIKDATVGVKGVFINPFPDFTDPDGEAKQTQRFVDAAHAAGTVETLVLSTSLNVGDHKQWLAEDPNYPLKQYYQSKAAAEDVVRGSGVKYWTIFRPSWLFQNYTFPASAIHFPQWHTDRVFSTAMRLDQPNVHFDAADIGPWTAAAFLDPAKFAGKEIKLGAESLTYAQVVQGIEQFTGVKIVTKALDPADVAKDSSDPMAGMRAAVAVFRNKVSADLTAAEYESLRSYGLPLTTFSEWLEKDKKAVFAALKIPV